MPVYSLEIEGVSYSDAYTEACGVAPVHRAVLVTLELDHPNFTEPGRIVADKRDLLATLEDDAPNDAGAEVLFRALPVQASMPTENDAGGSSVGIRIDGVSRLLADELDAAVGTHDPVTMLVREYASDDRSGPCRLPVPRFTLRNVRVNERTVMAEAVMGERINRAFPSLNYTAEKYPGLTSR